MVKHDFVELVVRKGTECKKRDIYGDDVMSMWIADTDFHATACKPGRTLAKEQ